MKKIVLSILLCGIMAFSFAGCATNKNQFDKDGKPEIETTQEGVSLSIKDGTLTNVGATLILKNNSNIKVEYGYPYEIEIKQNGEWRKINVDLAFALPAFEIKVGETKEIKLNWQLGYGKLTAGTYRIIKSINYDNEEGGFESFDVSTEFTIE